MFGQNSIRQRFFIQLFTASFILILLFSSFTYLYVKNSILNAKKEHLVQVAQNITTYQALYSAQRQSGKTYTNLFVTLVHLKHPLPEILLYESTIDGQNYITILYPFMLHNLSYLKITQDITPTVRLLDSIFQSIFFINIFGLIIILLYAIMLSKMLIYPIKMLTKRLSNINEHIMEPLNIHEIPREFEELGITINHLINRLQTFIKYQKELFIGTAHELKTPLAVIKLKNQVTLIKQRTPKEYIEALKVTNNTVDDMNIIVSNILNIGRQEGAQLERAVSVDIIPIINNKANDFKLLAVNEEKELIIDLRPSSFVVTIQPTLLNQIIQNFLQNALKFTPKHKTIKIQSYLQDEELVIEIIDEGCGIDTNIDLFAPFKRQGNKKGVGLGLFLAKSASDALGARITLTNRNDGCSGTKASLFIGQKLTCSINRQEFKTD